MKVVSIVGARPQFIKLGPLSRILRRKFDEVIIHTGQHYDENMSETMFKQLEIPNPDINLNIGSGEHGYQTGKMLMELEEKIKEIAPDLVITFGDTNTTLAASIVASKLETKLLHIEAGLRSFNKSIPEEINRIVADHTSDLLFAPTDNAFQNLLNEGLVAKTKLTGDIMVDSFNFIQSKIDMSYFNDLKINYDFNLLTLHRPYNVDDPINLKIIFKQLELVDEIFIFPCHPRTRNIIKNNQLKISNNVIIIDPIGYIQFQTLLKNAKKVFTDSGGLQKEAFIASIPCITLRTETEWIETVQSGWNILVDYKCESFLEKVKNFVPNKFKPELFGINVAEKMVNEIEAIILN